MEPTSDHPADSPEGLLTNLRLLATDAAAAAKAIEDQHASVVKLSEGARLAAAASVAAQEQNAVYSKYIEESRAHAEGAVAELDQRVTLGRQHAESLASWLASAQASLASTNSASDQALTASQQASSHAGDVQALLEAAKVHERDLRALAAVADQKEERIKDYEAQLQALVTQCSEQMAEIKRLLPGATSAGLASAFRSRRESFIKPAERWQYVFVGALVLLIVMACWGLSDTVTEKGVRELSEIVRLWLARLPIAGALIWLALHASREGALARRLEEDYGYKETVAASFNGFQERMKEVGNQVPAGSALARLCDDTLVTLSAAPGRIYERHGLTALPSSLAADVAKEIAEKWKAVPPAAAGN